MSTSGEDARCSEAVYPGLCGNALPCKDHPDTVESQVADGRRCRRCRAFWSWCCCSARQMAEHDLAVSGRDRP